MPRGKLLLSSSARTIKRLRHVASLYHALHGNAPTGHSARNECVLTVTGGAADEVRDALAADVHGVEIPAAGAATTADATTADAVPTVPTFTDTSVAVEHGVHVRTAWTEFVLFSVGGTWYLFTDWGAKPPRATVTVSPHLAPLLWSTLTAAHRDALSFELGEMFAACGTLADARAALSSFRGWLSPSDGKPKRVLADAAAADEAAAAVVKPVKAAKAVVVDDDGTEWTTV